MFGLIAALGCAGPPDDRHHPPRDVDDAFRDAVVDVIGADEAALRVPAVELARALHLLTFAGTHPMVAGAHALDAEQIVTILLDGLLARPTTTEDS